MQLLCQVQGRCLFLVAEQMDAEIVHRIAFIVPCSSEWPLTVNNDPVVTSHVFKEKIHKAGILLRHRVKEERN